MKRQREENKGEGEYHQDQIPDYSENSIQQITVQDQFPTKVPIDQVSNIQQDQPEPDVSGSSLPPIIHPSVQRYQLSKANVDTGHDLSNSDDSNTEMTFEQFQRMRRTGNAGQSTSRSPQSKSKTLPPKKIQTAARYEVQEDAKTESYKPIAPRITKSVDEQRLRKPSDRDVTSGGKQSFGSKQSAKGSDVIDIPNKEAIVRQPALAKRPSTAAKEKQNPSKNMVQARNRVHQENEEKKQYDKIPKLPTSPLGLSKPGLVSQNRDYKSRNQIDYDDSESADDLNQQEDTERNAPKAGINYLRAQQAVLMKEVEKNSQLMEIEQQKQALGANSDSDVKPNSRFKNFNDVFSGLTKSKNVQTQYPLVSCMITYNSKSAVTVTKKSDREYWVKQYSLETYVMTFQEVIGGTPTCYIKLKEVEQNSEGTQFAVAYVDDGSFRLRVFGEQTRTPEEIKATELDINKELGINNYTMPINNFPDPFITCTFTNDEIIFVNLFHNKTLTHHHFFYNLNTREISSKRQVVLTSNDKNFPYKCFFNTEQNEVYSFYRQGQSFRIPVTEIDSAQNKDKPPYYFEKIIDKDLGQMYLINETALVARCSSQILFFKLKIDEFTKEKHWINYHVLNIRGFVYFIKGNKRIQVTTDTKVYFYLIDPFTFMPTLENVMFNFMNCNMMMFGSRVKYGITYKTNQDSFDIYRRKYEHDFRVNVVEQNLDGSRALPIEQMNAFLVSKIDKIMFYDVDTYQEIKSCQLEIPLLKSTTREANQIISMQISQNENILAVISGKNLIMNEQKPNQLFIFKRIRDLNTNDMDKFELIKRIVIKDLPEFNKISMQFIFKITKGNKDPNTLIFAKQDELMMLNYETEEIQRLVKFEVPLSRQPEFFLMNDDQTVSIIASLDDGVYYNHRYNQFIDLDEMFTISNIKEIIHDHEDRVFYLLANKYQGKLGFFLVRFSEFNPAEFNFFIKQKNKLDISDADIAVMRNEAKGYKELVVTFKTIFINTYNVKVIDISSADPWTLFAHESFQLWESQISGFFLNKNKDFVTINRDGINVLSLGSFGKRSVKAQNGQEKMIHSLESTCYLKTDRNNLIEFQFAGDVKVINVIQQNTKKSAKTGDETLFQDVYKIRIHDITLRELLLFQSLYVCSTQSDILNLVKDQPMPAVFFKSFLELDGSNMVSILSFDSRSMSHLLGDSHKEFFQSEFPLFYKNRIPKSNNKEKFFYRSAIDNALKNNQVRAVGIIVEYIIKYQNTFVSQFLFVKNFQKLLLKGLPVTGLLNSNIFVFQFDFDEWPSTHTEENEYSRPYNLSIFALRDRYRAIFPEDKFRVFDEETEVIDSSKIYKVTYTLNTLPQLGEYVEEGDGGRQIHNEGVSLMSLCTDADELEIFDSENFQQVIKFKWVSYAKKMHLVGCTFHFAYMGILVLYIYNLYVMGKTQDKKFYETLLVFGVLYPAFYDMRQLWLDGPAQYFQDSGNYNDQLYIWCSVANVVSQNSTPFDAFHNKVLMTVILLQQIIKTFFFLRIFDSLSYIVTMINTVINDLKVFGLFFAILICLFSLIFAVIGVANHNIENDFREYYLQVESGEENPENFPNEEYDHIGLFVSYFLSTLRISLGDFDFEASTFLTQEENILFWIIWFMVVVMTCIIFLNFIIAEASASYDKVKQNLAAMVNQEKASLISEAEGIFFESKKDQNYFPKYVLTRKVDI